jgi:S-adenosylmethionine:tRNA ribosyltransferase-isomerase
MKLKDFSYILPEELIAQHPCCQRDQARMMMMQRDQEKIDDFHFFQLPDLLQKDDVLVVNDSLVIPARFFGRKTTGAILEILLLTKRESRDGAEIWEILIRPAKRLHENDIIDLDNGCKAKALTRISGKKWLFEFLVPNGLENYLNRYGRAPLPPYIKRRKNVMPYITDDRERYQTIYAKNPGSIAAPTAGLHFTGDVLQALQSKGIQIATITLHVGCGTFLPITEKVIENHVMEEEHYEIGVDAAEKINNAKRVIAVGTTSTRTIESAADKDGYIRPQTGETNLFIYPGYQFKRVNGLLTNFHLPQSSLFLLACTFAGTNFIKKAYRHAVDEHYRFYSYGDCMLIL